MQVIRVVLNRINTGKEHIQELSPWAHQNLNVKKLRKNQQRKQKDWPVREEKNQESVVFWRPSEMWR